MANKQKQQTNKSFPMYAYQPDENIAISSSSDLIACSSQSWQDALTMLFRAESIGNGQTFEPTEHRPCNPPFRTEVPEPPAQSNNYPIHYTQIKEDDIVCGRTKLAHSHIGNKRFRQIVKSFTAEYQNKKSRDEKGRIIKRILEMLEASGTRFLKCDNEENGLFWSPVDECQAYEKVSHALRSTRKTKDSQPKRKQVTPPPPPPPTKTAVVAPVVTSKEGSVVRPQETLSSFDLRNEWMNLADDIEPKLDDIDFLGNLLDDDALDTLFNL